MMRFQKLFEQFVVNDIQVIRLHVDRVIIYVVLKKNRKCVCNHGVKKKIVQLTIARCQERKY